MNLWQGLHLRFINDLLNKPKFRFTISVDPKHLQSKSDEEIIAVRNLVKRLNGLYYQQQDEFLEHGTRTFALGYPLLIKRDARQRDKILKAPVAIWYLDIQKDLHKSNTWTISRHEESPVLFNEVLRAHIETNDRIKLDDLLTHFDADFINEQKLSEICNDLIEKLGTTSTEQDNEVKVLPGTNKQSIEKITKDDPWIRWSGIFGLYKTQKQSIIRDMEQFLADPELLNLPDNSDRPTNSAGLPAVFPAVITDPSQEFILTTLRNHDNLIIQGPPGTGKSQSLTAIITDALYNEKTCLVVCEKKTALDVIHTNLSNVGLAELCVIIEDLHRDRGKVVERVRHLLDIRDEEIQHEFRHHEYEETKNAYLNLRQKTHHELSAINTACFGDDSVSDLVARVRRLEEENAIGEIHADHSELFSDADYETSRSLMDIVDKGSRLFKPIGKILPYDELHNNLFKDASAQDIFPDIKESVEQISKLLDTHTRTLENYGKWYADGTKWHLRRARLRAVFSRRMKEMVGTRQDVLASYDQLKQLWDKRTYYSIDLPGREKYASMNTITGPLKMALEQLQSLLPDEDKFETYRSWRIFRDQQNEKTSRLLQRLAIDIPSKGWNATFSHAYLSEFIRQYCSSHILDGDLANRLSHMMDTDERSLQMIPDKILVNWQDKQRSVYKKKTISAVKQLYNFRRNKTYGRRNSLRKMVQADPKLFSATFPILLVSPTVCSSILPLQKDLFDHVIFDEASQLRLEDTFAALFRGKKKIISGDKHQMPPSSYFMQNVVLMEGDTDEEMAETSDDFLAESNSLLEYGTDTDFKSVFLDFHYRSQHPNLIAFSNAAFYGNRLVPMPAKQEYEDKPLEFHPVDGVYTKNRINPKEAEEIARYLYDEIPTAHKEAPSIGIATFNINQRNHIWDLLIEKTIEDPVKALILDRLLEKGLFIKNLENIQGDERDIMLISTTFGPNEEGRFRQQFGPVTRNDGYRLLNVIITRARKKMVVFTSVPSSIRSQSIAALQEKGLSGNSVFYSWLSFVEATSQGQTDRRDQLLEWMDEHCIEKPFLHESKRMPLFHQLIYGALRDRFGADQVVHNFKFGGFLMDLAIVINGRPVVAISTNHMKQQTTTSYKLFSFKSKMLKQHGVKPYVADVLDWHKDWNGEFDKLVDVINSVMGDS